MIFQQQRGVTQRWSQTKLERPDEAGIVFWCIQEISEWTQQTQQDRPNNSLADWETRLFKAEAGRRYREGNSVVSHRGSCQG